MFDTINKSRVKCNDSINDSLTNCESNLSLDRILKNFQNLETVQSIDVKQKAQKRAQKNIKF